MRFFYHFNKPESKRLGKPQISIHYKKSCSIVDNIVINTSTFGRLNKTQPYFTVVGDAKSIEIVDRIAYIN